MLFGDTFVGLFAAFRYAALLSLVKKFFLMKIDIYLKSIKAQKRKETYTFVSVVFICYRITHDKAEFQRLHGETK